MSMSESTVLQLALKNLEEQRRQIDAEIDELRAMLKKHGIHRRRKIAGFKNQVDDLLTSRDRKPRRQMSEAQKTAISEKMRQRWGRTQSKPKLTHSNLPGSRWELNISRSEYTEWHH